MQKIMFNDKYGLTKAVLEGRKTMTRRIIPEKLVKAIEGGMPGYAVMESRYKVGEVVAVAQPYKDVTNTGGYPHPLVAKPGWTNKMFVRADLMLHQIRITNVRVERLQDISDEDCLREGILEDCPGLQYSFPTETGYCGQYPFYTPREAFAALIDNITGNGTWERNPWVFVYEFELLK